MARHWDFEALDRKGYLPAAGVDAAQAEDFEVLQQFAADNSGTAIAKGPVRGEVHRDAMVTPTGDDLLVNAVQLQDGDHVITVGWHRRSYGGPSRPSASSSYDYDSPVFSITALRRLPDCDVRVHGHGSTLIWGSRIDPDDDGDNEWPDDVQVWSTTDDRAEVRQLLDAELLDLLTHREIPHGLRIRSGLAVLETERTHGLHKRAEWEQRARLVEALIVRNATFSRAPGRRW